MANNRMWLVHKPTNKRYLLAQHLGDGWYEIGPETTRVYPTIQALLDDTPWNNTDFVIEYEA